MAAKRVASAKQAEQKNAAEKKLRKARGMLANLLYQAESHPDILRKTTVDEWHEVFTQILQAIQ